MTSHLWRLGAPVALCLCALLPAQGQAPEVRTLTGEVVIRSIASQRIVVAMDSSNEGKPADGIADSVFYFVAGSPLEKPVSLRFPLANLEARPRSLSVAVPGRGVVLWADVEPAEEGGLERQSGGGLIFKDGVELTEYHGRIRLRLKDLATARDASRVRGVERPKTGGRGWKRRDKTCSSGGPDSTSSSVTCKKSSGSTSCGGSLYSCCNCVSGRAICACKP